VIHFIEDVEVGKKIDHDIVITEALHRQFAELSGDRSPIHWDQLFCEKTRFKKKIGYAFLITAILSKIYGMIFPGGSELCMQQSCNFRNPFYIGDRLHFNLHVTHKNETAKTITIRTVVTNQENTKVFQGEALLQLSLGVE